MSDSNIDKIIEIINRSEINRDYDESRYYKKDVFKIYFKDKRDLITFIDLMDSSDDLEESSVFKIWISGNAYLYSFYRLKKKNIKNVNKNLSKRLNKLYLNDEDIILKTSGNVLRVLKKINYFIDYYESVNYCVSNINEIKKSQELREKIEYLINSLRKNRIDEDENEVCCKHIISYAIDSFIKNINAKKIKGKIINRLLDEYYIIFKRVDLYKYPFYITDEITLDKISQIFNITSKSKNDGLVAYLNCFHLNRFFFIKNCNNSNIYKIEPSNFNFYSETLPNNIFIYESPIFYEIYRYLRNKELNVESAIESIDIYYKKYEKLVNEVLNYIEKESEKIYESFMNDWNNDNKIKKINDEIFNTDEYRNFEIIKALNF